MRYILFLGLFGLLPISSMAQCRHALALALDVSGSVNLREYRLQMDGLVTALNDPDVVSILLAHRMAPVSLMVFEWSGPDDQAVLVPWTSVTSRSELNDISLILARSERQSTSPGTALGTAMQTGARYLEEMQHCWKRTLDVSGDGTSNQGPRPRDVRDDISASGITVNGLVIGASSPKVTDRRETQVNELVAYFEAEVITGTDSFVQPALGFEAYGQAMAVKLKRELDGLAVSVLQ